MAAMPGAAVTDRAPGRSPVGQPRWGMRLLAVNCVAALAFLYLPMVVLVAFSFNDSRLAATWQGFTLRWYEALADNSSLIAAATNSLVVAVVSTVLATILGTMVALGMERYRFRGRRPGNVVLYLPIVTPEIMTGVALLAFFSLAFSALNDTLGLNGPTALRSGLQSVILTHTAFNTAFVAVVVRTSLRGFDRSLEEAARDLGASEWRALWRVTLPLIAPGIAGGAMLAFTLSLDNIVITSFVTGPGATTLPIDVFGRIRRAISPEINAISTLMLAASVVLVVLSLIALRTRDGGRSTAEARPRIEAGDRVSTVEEEQP